LENDVPVGTFALMINELEELELTKMGMHESSIGKGYGNELMKHCIEQAKLTNHREIYLYSNTSLRPAIHLYKKYGFEEIPLGSSEYERCNIKMKLNLK
jgi:ribosomal protein S18 acetylase RimI-like enzyme